MSKLNSVPNGAQARRDVLKCGPSTKPFTEQCPVTSTRDCPLPTRSPRPLPKTKKHKRSSLKDELQGCYLSHQDMPPESSNLKLRNRASSPLSHAPSRRSNKPQMEKKRRQRERESMTKIREFISTAFKVDPSKYLDKAEILEKTVKLLNYIMSKHYSSESKDKKFFDINNLSFKENKIRLDNVINSENLNISPKIESNIDIGNLNIQGNHINLSSCPSNNKDNVVTWVIPQANNIQRISNYLSQLPNTNNNLVRNDGAKQPATVKFVVNNNYYMRNGQSNSSSCGEPSSPESASSCEVSSSDSSSSSSGDNLSEESFQGNYAYHKIHQEAQDSFQHRFSPEKPDNFDFPKRYSTVKSDRLKMRCVPNVRPQQMPFGQRLIAPKPSYTNSNLHRPWEK